MKEDELARQLDGSNYPFRLPQHLADEAQRSGLVVVYGVSDDLMEFEGVIQGELDAWCGTIAYLNSKGLIENKCEDEDCPYFKESLKNAATIKAVWGRNHISWQYETMIPHASFRIMDRGEIDCIGIVFKLSDVTAV